MCRLKCQKLPLPGIRTMKKFKIVSLGCRTNQYEAQGYRDQLAKLGYTQAQEGEEADLCVVNTCTVTENADRESRHAVKQLAKKNPQARIYVTGCASDGDAEGFLNLPQVAVVKRNKEKETLLEDLGELPEFSIAHFEAHTRAFVKVQDGCNSFCSYCIIPYVRGRSRSRPVDEILKEIEELIRNGYQEIVLTGINIGDYEDRGLKLAALLKQVDALPLKRVRLSSIDPDEVDEPLMEAILLGKNTCPSLHIVLQSGSNAILKRMNRKYTRQIFLNTVERLKEAHPDFTFTTDVIVGFPGETETDFFQTLEVMDRVKFAKVHMFPYSVRQRTKAAQFTDQVPSEIMAERKNTILRLAEKNAYELRQNYVGRKMAVLTEDAHFGHTANFLPVFIDCQPNQLVEAVLRSNTEKGLMTDADYSQAAV